MGKTTKRKKSKLSKNRIFILICLIMLVIFEIVAFRNSRASKILEITASIIDNATNVDEKQITLQATNTGQSGYLIILPEYIDNKKIDSYIIMKKAIHETEAVQSKTEIENIDTTINTEKTEEKSQNINTETENTIKPMEIEREEETDIQKTEKENIENSVNEDIKQNIDEGIQETQNIIKIPGEALYLSDEEIKEQAIKLTVEYSMYQKDEQTLYEQIIQTDVDDEEDGEIDTNIKIEGFMPLNAIVQAKAVAIDDIEESIANILTDKVSFKKAYDIKIMYNEKEYEPTTFDTNVKVTISGIDEINESKQKYKVVHIDDEEIVKEVEGVKTIENTIIFPADSFSTYALLLEDGISTASSYSSNIESASIWEGEVATSFKYGKGTQTEPYLISSASELAFLANQVNNGMNYDGNYFSLIVDINLDNKEWTPIGNYNNSFKGVFNGEGHTIANAKISLPTTLPTSITSYGLFGSIGNSTNKTTIKNLQLDNFEIEINANGTTANNTTEKGYNIGIVSGTMFNNSEIINVIVNNSSIMDNYTMTIRNNSVSLFVGGIAGFAVNSTNSTADPGNNTRYLIENCFSNVSFDLDTTYSSSYNNMAQYAVGGIIGGIRSQAVWPTNCLFKGTINATYGFTGPIFGYLRNNTGFGTNYNYSNNFNTLWQGNDAGNLTMSSYYTSYSTNNRAFTSNVESGNSTNRIATNMNRSMGYVQGVNKGLYTNDASNMLSNFNNYVTNNLENEYLTWYYDSDTEAYYFTPELSANIEEDIPKYIININDKAQTGNYEYMWYINDELDTEVTGNTITLEQSWTDSKKVEVLISNGKTYSMINFRVPKLEIHISFEMNNKDNVLTAGIEGTGTTDSNFNLNDYTYEWYILDIAEAEEKMEGEVTNKISELENGMQYRIVATNTKYPYMSTEGVYTYGTRTVIYCRYNGGKDYNDGLTPQTPVQTLSTAYSKFSSTTTRNENIIVLMGTYTDSNFLNSSTSTTYRKNVTITGRYQGTDYDASLYFESYNDYKYLNGNTTFMHLKFDGEGYQTYFYLQGYSLTMGEGVTMVNYGASNTNQGLIQGNAPAFHMFAGWLQYDETRLPRTGAKILIKSGTYGRILLGGSSGTSSASSITKYNSHNFMGTSLTNDLYQSEITIDIKNSTTSTNYAYDINLLGGGSTCGNIYGDIKINVKQGNIGRLLGASIGDSSYRPNNWQYPVNTFIGTATINMTGGNVTEMYGGCLGRNMQAIGGNDRNPIKCDSYFYGTVNINISGGTIEQTVYGAGAGGVSGYSENSSDVYKSYGQGINTIVNINIIGGTINADIYGGGYGYTNYLTANSTQADGGTLYGSSNINISGSPIINGNIYGSGRGYDLSANHPNLAQMEGDCIITISGTPSITGNIYGAGMGLANYPEMAKLTGNTTININASLETDVFGGGNIAKTVGNTYININDGIHVGKGTKTADIYGGGNVGILSGTSNVIINGGTSKNIYGGGKSADVTNSNIYIKDGENTNIYGGGNQAGSQTTNIEITGGNTSTVYGGSNQSGTVNETTIAANGGSCTNIYGGNNLGGSCNKTTIEINGTSINEAVYGGGNQVATINTYVILEESGNIIPYIYGGGKSANVTNTDVVVNGGSATNVFGGSNTNGIVTTSNVTIYGGNITNAFGGNNAGGTTITSNVTLDSKIEEDIVDGIKMELDYTVIEAEDWLKNQNPGYQTYITVNIKYINNTKDTINKWSSYIQIPDSKLLDNYSSDSKIIEEDNKYIINQDSRWSAGVTHSLFANGTYEVKDLHFMSKFSKDDIDKIIFKFEGQGDSGQSYQNTNTGLTIYGGNNEGGETTTSNININSGYCYAVYGGNNKGGQNITSNINVNGGKVTEVYGGNNLGGINTNSNVNISNGKVTNVYGGGNKAVTNTPSVLIQNKAKIDGCIYGGGNQAGIQTNTTVEILGGTIEGNVYGGGNEGTVTGNTYVHVKDAILNDSLYAGGNGTTAIIYGNANLIVEGTNTKIKENVFGGGNQAATGTQDDNNSLSTVNIVGGNIGKNVYGGANTSVVYGNTLINIGYEAVSNTNLTYRRYNNRRNCIWRWRSKCLWFRNLRFCFY